MTPSVRVRPNRSEGTRCVIVEPGDVLILAGIDQPGEDDASALTGLKELLGLRAVVVCRDLADVEVRDLDAELADAREELAQYGRLFEVQQKTLDKTTDELLAVRREILALAAERAAR